MCMRAFKIVTYPSRGIKDSLVLASCGDCFTTGSADHQDMDIGLSQQSDSYIDRSSLTEVCFHLYCEAKRSVNNAYNKLSICLNDVDLHCYPHIIGLLIGFFDRISSYGASGAGEIYSTSDVDDKNPKTVPCFLFQRFGFSNYFETGSSDQASISLDSYPFITICNHGYLGGLESSLLYPIPEWRKVFNLRDRKFRNPKCSSLKKRSETLHASSWKSKSNMVALPFSGSFDYANQFLIDINLCGIRVHFHDSSCIIGTVTLPSSKSSLLVYENCMDILFSVEGLVLTSSWWTKSFHKFLWGPSLPNLSPILNLRVRMRNAGSLSSQLEVSIGVQHICCVLPTEYLAVIMGYFSLPDWSPNSSKNIYSENASSMVYKFEVLDSTLIVPVEKDDHQFLKVEIQQLYCSIIDKCTANNVVMDIPYEYMVPQHKLAETNDCVNIFGRDLVLSFVPLKDDGYGYLNCDQDIGDRNIILISPLNADVWVRIPWECKPTCEGSSASICIMSRIHNCQVIADGRTFLSSCSAFGYELLYSIFSVK